MSRYAGGTHNLLTAYTRDRFFYDYRTQTLTMSVTTKLHAAGANQFFYANRSTLLAPPSTQYTFVHSDSSRAAPYSEENVVKEDGETKVNRTMQVPDHRVACIIEPKYRYRLRHMKADSDASQRKDSEDGQKEKEAPPLKQAASSKQGKAFSAQLYSMEVAHSETLRHALYKVSSPVDESRIDLSTAVTGRRSVDHRDCACVAMRLYA